MESSDNIYSVADELLFPPFVTTVNRRLSTDTHCHRLMQETYHKDWRQEVASSLNVPLHQLMNVWEPLQKPDIAKHFFKVVAEAHGSLCSRFVLDVNVYKGFVKGYVRWYRIKESEMVNFWCGLVDCLLRCPEFVHGDVVFREWAFSVLSKHVLREKQATGALRL